MWKCALKEPPQSLQTVVFAVNHGQQEDGQIGHSWHLGWRIDADRWYDSPLNKLIEPSYGTVVAWHEIAPMPRDYAQNSQHRNLGISQIRPATDEERLIAFNAHHFNR